MGYWGYFVVGRSERPLAESDALGGVRGVLEPHATGDGAPPWMEPAGVPGGRWQVWECPGSAEGVPRDIGSMNTLALETGAPALFGYVMDSDCVVLEAAAPESGAWTACLGRAAMAGYLGADGLSLEDYFLEPRDAAERAVAWAAEAGRSVPAGPLLDVLTADPDPLAEQLFFRLLDTLGVGPEGRER